MGVETLISVGFGLYQVNEQRKAVKAEKKRADKLQKAEKVKQRISDVRAQREQRQVLARARIQQANLEAGGFASGIGGGSSALLGSIGSLQSTVAGNQGFANSLSDAANQVSIFNEQAAAAGTDALSSTGRALLADKVGSIFDGTTFK